jgi:membrane protein DedA with SNARE-associated domain
MYLLSRRYGRRLAMGWPGRLLHLTPGRLERAEVWFRRWGVLAIIFGRHIPGCRIPITVAAGVFAVPWPVFAASVAVSTAVWAGFFLAMGILFGRHAQELLSRNRWGLLAVPVLACVGLVGLLIYRHRTARAPSARRGAA